jgi:hypothetical protein
MPDDWTPTASPHVRKMIVQPIRHLACKVRRATIILKLHALVNINGYILQEDLLSCMYGPVR